MKRLLIILAVIAVLAALVVVGIRRGKTDKGTEVYAEAAARRDIAEVVKASGEIDPRVKVNLSSPLIAKIERMYVEEGQQVTAGQRVLDLEKEAFTAQRDQWAAQLRSAQTAVRQAEVNLADTRNKLKRAQSLSNDGILSREQLEASELQETSARLALDESREAVHQARANLDKARDDLSKTSLYAPLSGTVIKLNAEEGEVVVSGTMNNPASVIGTIADLSEILARVDVDETEVVDVELGQEAVLKVDALPGREYHGKVVEVGSSGVARTNQPDVTFFEVKVLLDDPDKALRPGMSVRAEIRADAHQQALVVPIQAVVERQPLASEEKPAEKAAAATAAGSVGSDSSDRDDDREIKVVFVVADGKARQRPVEAGLSDETHVEILAGLKPGEQVVTGPYRTLRDLDDGDAVTIGKPETGKSKRDKAGEGDDGDDGTPEDDDQDEENR